MYSPPVTRSKKRKQHVALDAHGRVPVPATRKRPTTFPRKQQPNDRGSTEAKNKENTYALGRTAVARTLGQAADENGTADYANPLALPPHAKMDGAAMRHRGDVDALPQESEELTPLPPDEVDAAVSEVKAALRSWADTPWVAQFEALMLLRRLSRFHANRTVQEIFLNQPADAAVSAALHAGGSLRSSLARSGILCLRDMFVGVGKHMRHRSEAAVVHQLINATAATDKRFLIAAAREALDAAVEFGPIDTLLPALVGQLAHKRPDAAAVAAVMVERSLGTLAVGRELRAELLLKQPLNGIASTTQLLRALRTAVQGRNGDGRAAAKKCCRRIQRDLGPEAFHSAVEEALAPGDSSGKLLLQQAVAETRKQPGDGATGSRGLRELLRQDKLKNKRPATFEPMLVE